MKKLIIILIALWLANFWYWYQSSLEDNKILWKSYNQIDEIYKKDNWIAKLNIIKNIISNKLETEKDERNIYLLSLLNSYLAQILPKPELLPREENIIKQESPENDKSNNQKVQLLSSLWKWVVNKEWLSKLCFDKYELVDSIAKEHNFPTELIIATWKMETNCHFQNPWNWKWPFQIMSYYYKPWKITQQQFKQSVIDFINFSKNKWSRHNRKQLFKKWKLNITYDNYSLEDIRIHWVLYNSIAKKPTTSPYVNWNLTSKNKYKKDWLIVNILKVLKEKI